MEKPANTKSYWTERYREDPPSPSRSEFLNSLRTRLRNKKILDAGCGAGHFAVECAAEGVTVVALDFCESAIEQGKKLAAERGVTVQFRVQDLDFFLPELMAYDAIILSHVRPGLQFLKNAARGLTTRGLLIVEAYLSDQLNIKIADRKSIPKLELFETYRPNELLEIARGYRIEFYDERPKSGEHKVVMIAEKAGPL